MKASIEMLRRGIRMFRLPQKSIHYLSRGNKPQALGFSQNLTATRYLISGFARVVARFLFKLAFLAAIMISTGGLDLAIGSWDKVLDRQPLIFPFNNTLRVRIFH